MTVQEQVDALAWLWEMPDEIVRAMVLEGAGPTDEAGCRGDAD